MTYDINKEFFEYHFTIELELDGGTCSIDSIDATVGKLIGLLPNASKGSLVCEGWYYDSALTNRAQMSDIAVASNDKLYPKYIELNDCTQVTFNIEYANANAGIYIATKRANEESIIVDWGDGTIDVFNDDINKVKHSYASAGSYNVRISDSVSLLGISSGDESWNKDDGPTHALVAVSNWSSKLSELLDYSFCNTSIASIDIPSTITLIGTSIFIKCSNLRSITVDAANQIYDSRDECNAVIRKADDTLIAGCAETIIPDSVVSLGRECFKYIQGVYTFNIPTSVTTIGIQAFAYNGISHITLPDSITSIGGSTSSTDSAFYSSELTTVDIQCPNADFGIYTFIKCSYLQEVTLPEGITEIRAGMFLDCRSMTKITLPSTITRIGTYSLAYCYRLQTIVSYAEQAPEVFSTTFNGASVSASTPRTIYTIVPLNYETSYWQSTLVDTRGFTITTIEE